jgi:hypothetical protein
MVSSLVRAWSEPPVLVSHSLLVEWKLKLGLQWKDYEGGGWRIVTRGAAHTCVCCGIDVTFCELEDGRWCAQRHGWY